MTRFSVIRFLTCFGLTLAGTFAHFSTAATITETVIVGDTEWAQANLFADLSWNQINSVCPAGICGAGSLNGLQLSDWTWASQIEVGEHLFVPFPFTNYTAGDDSQTILGDVFSPVVGRNKVFSQ
ncbi:MAG: hypothetical protein ACI9BW_001278 [Gammaproteobacteria bacterium]|jgi:hypothetical protein